LELRSPLSDLWAIVPVKRLRRAKSRLARSLKANQRAALARSMLARTLDLLAAIDRVAGVAVITSDLTAQDIARAKNAIPLAETEAGLNAAVAQACAWAAAQGAPGALIVPIDLPLLTASDIESMIDLAIEPSCVVIAPDRHDEGTNALLLRPPQVIQPAFGVSSCEAHRVRAAEQGVPSRIFRSMTISLDIDLPADLERYRQLVPLIDVVLDY